MKTELFTIKKASKGTFLDLKEEIDKKIEKVDFYLIAVNSCYDLEVVGNYVEEIFQTDDFLLFSAIDHFDNSNVINNGITVCCFVFQRKGYLKHFYVDALEEKSEEALSHYLNEKKECFHIGLVSSENGGVDRLLDAVSNNLTYTPVDNIVGGVCSAKIDEQGNTKPSLYFKKKHIYSGIFILTFYNVEAYVGVSLGFQPYGITYKMTKVSQNRLYTVDDGKKFSYLTQKLLSNLNPKSAKTDIRHLWYSPLVFLNDEHGYATTLRTFSRITDEYVEFFADLPEDGYFKLSFATPQDLLFADKKAARELHEKLQKPELLLNFSCVARQYVLEDMQEDEAKSYLKGQDGTNLFGFFTFGEIGPDPKYKSLKFYNETSLVVAMKEKG